MRVIAQIRILVLCSQTSLSSSLFSGPASPDAGPRVKFGTNSGTPEAKTKQKGHRRGAEPTSVDVRLGIDARAVGVYSTVNSYGVIMSFVIYWTPTRSKTISNHDHGGCSSLPHGKRRIFMKLHNIVTAVLCSVDYAGKGSGGCFEG